VRKCIEGLEQITYDRNSARRTSGAWLSVAWDIAKPPDTLVSPFNLSAEEFARLLRHTLPPRRRTLSVAAVAAIQAEHAATVAPIAARLAESARLERELSNLVNRAYGLTPEEERLMWQTAPPRMPIPPPDNEATG
jgi:hypothetical protein